MNSNELRYTLLEGKYTLVFNQLTGEFKCLRHGERWRDLSGDKMVLALMQAVMNLEDTVSDSAAQRSEVVVVKSAAWLLFKQALYVGMERGCTQYLMANAHGRRDGALKAHNHEQLCRHIIAAVRGCTPDQVRWSYEDDYQVVHAGTQALTSYLDEVIGFPLDSRPDYSDLVPKFFDKFVELAMTALGITPATQQHCAPVEQQLDSKLEQQLRSELDAAWRLVEQYKRAAEHARSGVQSDDLIVWSDGTVCMGSELHQMAHMSDDYEVVKPGTGVYQLVSDASDGAIKYRKQHGQPTQRTTGVYNKFTVYRNDGRDKPGGDRHGAQYFVLDVTHDKFAAAALTAYADVCAKEYPSLADDLINCVQRMDEALK